MFRALLLHNEKSLSVLYFHMYREAFLFYFFFLISGWNASMSLAISPLSNSIQIRFGIAIRALAMSEKFHTRLSV